MLHEHIKRWVRWGHEVTIYTVRYRGAPKEENRDGIRIVRAGGKFTVYLWAPILYWRRLRRETDAVLDIENGIPFFAPLYSRKPRLCLVHHVHQNQFLWEFGPVVGRVGRFIEHRLMPLIYHRTCMVAVSQSTLHDLARIGVPISNTRIVHNGLDHEAYYPVSEKSLTPRLAYVGRLKRHKRVDLIIDVCAKTREAVPGLELDIAGRGDDEKRLRAHAAKRGLQQAVRFHGFIPQMHKVALYSRAWAFITATEREGWGLSVMEAAACGTPTVALDAPGIRDAVVSGASGALATDINQLCHLVVLLLSDHDWRRRLSQGAIRRARDFSWDRSAAELREALTDAWLDRYPALRRRARSRVERVQVPLSLTMRFGTSTAEQEAVRMARSKLRAGDAVECHDGTVSSQVWVDDVTALSRIEDRLCRILEHAEGADVGNSQPGAGSTLSRA